MKVRYKVQKNALNRDPQKEKEKTKSSIRVESQTETHYSGPDCRLPITTDIGGYLKSVRVNAGVHAAELARDLGLSTSSITTVENNTNSPPSPERLYRWLYALGETERFPEALALLRQYRTHRTIYFRNRDEANEHIDRIIDAYERFGLSDVDIVLLRMVCPNEYETHKRPPPKKKAVRAEPSPGPKEIDPNAKAKFINQRIRKG